MSKEDLEVKDEGTIDEGALEQQDEGAEGVGKDKQHMDYDAWVAAGKDPKEWKSKQVFDEIGSLRKRVEQMDKAIGRYKQTEKKFDETIKKLAEATTKQVKADRERLIADLKAQQKEARRNDDHDKADDLAEEISDIKLKGKEQDAEVLEVVDEAQEQQKEIVRATTEWMSQPENKWYKNANKRKTDADHELGEEADYAFVRALQRGKSPEEALEAATRRVQKEFPEHFKSKSGSGKSKISESGDDNKQGNIKPNTKGKVPLKSIPTEFQKIAKEMSNMNPKAYPSAQDYVDAMVASGTSFN